MILKKLLKVLKQVQIMSSSEKFSVLAQTILLVSCLGIFTSSKAIAKNSLQLKLGDTVSIYSEKAYRKNNGMSFEAIGSVVIISGNDTMYGEKASLNVESGDVLVEGNVRFISQDITIYGSRISLKTGTNKLTVENARIITSEFNIVAEKVTKIASNKYVADKAEFTTCKDCTESWSIYGEEVHVELNQYIKIYHALTKVKGVSVLYFPFIALPIKNKRESGLLFPDISTRNDEGIGYTQPIYWAIDDSKDMTISPSFMAKRGYGSDIEFRQAITDQKWVNFNSKLLNDSIYLPGKNNEDLSGGKYFRHFYSAETHLQWNNSLTQHIKITGMKDLEMIRDFDDYTDEYINDSDVGFFGFLEGRSDRFQLGLETQFRKNLLYSDSEEFDKTYVQTVPSVYFNMAPYTLLQSDTLLLQNISFGADGDITNFKQMGEDEVDYIRNATRANITPYINWHMLTYGPINLKTNYTLDYQTYKFINDDEENFNKYAGLFQTEISFSMDRIFGLAYEEKVPVRNLNKKYLEKKNQEAEALESEASKKKKEDKKSLIGAIPDFESSLTKDSIVFVKNSYRHSQEYKFIHHYILHDDEQGNERFRTQIAAGGGQGWFDYRDAVRSEVSSLGTNETRTGVPVKNTVELQWNNELIKKTPRSFNYFEDNKYLRNNFSYSKIGYLNISQGFTFEDEQTDFKDKLTRLSIATGYSGSSWNIGLQEYYFHQGGQHVFTANFQKQFDALSVLSNYAYNSLGSNDIKTAKIGAQVRPLDVLGFSVLKEHDLDTDTNISTIYQVDIMPNNNCWIFNINYKQTVVDSQYTFNYVFNFGNDEFHAYRRNFWSFVRL